MEFEVPKICFQDGDLDIKDEYYCFELIKNFVGDGHKIIDLHKFQKQTFINLIEKNYDLKTFSLADFLMAPEEILAENIIHISNTCTYLNENDLDLIKDAEFLK